MTKDNLRQAMDHQLSSQQFYDLMQVYRHTPVENQIEVGQAFLAVIEFVLDSAENLAPPNVGQVEVTIHE